MKNEIAYEEWLRTGRQNGWCGPVVCATHDAVPTTAQEEREWDEGGDPCVWVVRVYLDESERLAVEENHAPSQWR